VTRNLRDLPADHLGPRNGLTERHPDAFIAGAGRGTPVRDEGRGSDAHLLDLGGDAAIEDP